jgi:hypothetical protein
MERHGVSARNANRMLCVALLRVYVTLHIALQSLYRHGFRPIIAGQR